MMRFHSVCAPFCSVLRHTSLSRSSLSSSFKPSFHGIAPLNHGSLRHFVATKALDDDTIHRISLQWEMLPTSIKPLVVEFVKSNDKKSFVRYTSQVLQNNNYFPDEAWFYGSRVLYPSAHTFADHRSYHTELMEGFFRFYSNEPCARDDISRKAFIAAVMDSDHSMVPWGARVDLMSALYGNIRQFMENEIRNECLGRYHLGTSGIGKSRVLERAVSILPHFFDGLVTAFVSLSDMGLKSGFDEPPHPHHILKMAQKSVDYDIKKLFVVYDDYEKAYEMEWGPSLTGSVYCEMNRNIEIMVHVISSSQWLPVLLPKTLQQKVHTLNNDKSDRFPVFGHCSMLTSCRCGPFIPSLQPCLKEDEFYELLVSIWAEHKIGMMGSDDMADVYSEDDIQEARKAAFFVYWLTGGNARKMVQLFTYFKCLFNDCSGIATFEWLWLLLSENQNQLSDDVFATMGRFVDKLIEANEDPQGAKINLARVFTQPGVTMENIGDLSLRNDFMLTGVNAHDQDLFGSEYKELYSLVDAGLLVYDKKRLTGMIYPGTPLFLPWFAMCRDEKDAEKRRHNGEKLLQHALDLFFALVKNGSFWKIRLLLGKENSL